VQPVPTDSDSCGPRRVSLLATVGVMSALVLSGVRATAEVQLWDRDGATLRLSSIVATGYFHTAGTNFGAGRVRDGATNIDWAEAYVKPTLMGGLDTHGWGYLYGGVGYVATASRGDGDAGDFTPSATQALDNEQLYAGWRSGILLPALGNDALDISFGRQEFSIGDGFLIWDGNYDVGNEGTYRLLARRSFERAGLVRVNTQPVRGDLFYLQADRDNGHPELYGANLEYVDTSLGTLGLTYFSIFRADEELAQRNGLDVVSVRGHGTPFAAVGVPNAAFAFEYAHEQNDHPGREVAAAAWYLQAGYTFAALPWSPSLKYRYGAFGGDDPRTRKSEAFDPLFYSYSTGWDTWIQGEIAGSYLLFNSNEDVHMVHASAQPNESLDLGILYWRLSLDEPGSLLTSFKNPPFKHAPTATDFADEVNAYVDWTMNAHLSFSGVFGVAVPRTGARQAFDQGHAYELLEIYATLTL
jgi:hypothetical protein